MGFYDGILYFGKTHFSLERVFSMDPPCRRTPTDDSIKSCMFCLVVSCYKKEEIGKCKDDLLAICYFTLLYFTLRTCLVPLLAFLDARFTK